MKDLPATFGLPSQLDVMWDELRGPSGDKVVEGARKAVHDLLRYLRWLLTSPMPPEEYVVAESLSEACEAALDVLDSRSIWSSLPSGVDAESEL